MNTGPGLPAFLPVPATAPQCSAVQRSAIRGRITLQGCECGTILPAGEGQAGRHASSRHSTRISAKTSLSADTADAGTTIRHSNTRRFYLPSPRLTTGTCRQADILVCESQGPDVDHLLAWRTRPDIGSKLSLCDYLVRLSKNRRCGSTVRRELAPNPGLTARKSFLVVTCPCIYAWVTGLVV